MTRRHKHLENISALGALNAITDPLRVSDFENVSFSLAGENTSVLTVTVYGAIGESKPDFTTAKALDNEYDTIDVVDYQDSASLNGDTGIAFTADDVRLLMANIDGLDWIAFKVTAYTSGDVTPKLSCYTNI